MPIHLAKCKSISLKTNYHGCEDSFWDCSIVPKYKKKRPSQ